MGLAGDRIWHRPYFPPRNPASDAAPPNKEAFPQLSDMPCICTASNKASAHGSRNPPPRGFRQPHLSARTTVAARRGPSAATARADRSDVAPIDPSLARPAPPRQKDLAATLVLDGSSVVRLLDALAAGGLIERQEESADRRAKVINLTARGLAIVDLAEATARDVRDAALAGISDTEIAAAARTLERIRRNLELLSEAVTVP